MILNIKYKRFIATICVIIVVAIWLIFPYVKTSWMKFLTSDQVARIEVISQPSEENQRYMVATQEQIEQYVKKIQNISYKVLFWGSNTAGTISIYYITLTDGTRHKVYATETKLCIDGLTYIVAPTVLEQWGYIYGNQCVPEDFEY